MDRAKADAMVALQDALELGFEDEAKTVIKSFDTDDDTVVQWDEMEHSLLEITVHQIGRR
ncbi:MAG: hypothetical protein AAF384_18260 [Pseudomonadota bacterium]